jgi:hypothetical protein
VLGPLAEHGLAGGALARMWATTSSTVSKRSGRRPELAHASPALDRDLRTDVDDDQPLDARGGGPHS